MTVIILANLVLNKSVSWTHGSNPREHIKFGHLQQLPMNLGDVEGTG